MIVDLDHRCALSPRYSEVKVLQRGARRSARKVRRATPKSIAKASPLPTGPVTNHARRRSAQPLPETSLIRVFQQGAVDQPLDRARSSLNTSPPGRRGASSPAASSASDRRGVGIIFIKSMSIFCSFLTQVLCAAIFN